MKIHTAVVALLTLTACSSKPTATARIEARSGSQVVGSAIFTVDGNTVTMEVGVEKAPPGEHGLHLHQTGDCSAADATSAGGHWNPAAAAHGDPAGAAHHAGDMGNLTVGADGRGRLSFSTTAWTYKSTTSTTTEFLGRALILHANKDDFSQPAGNAGMRIGCGVIVADQ